MTREEAKHRLLNIERCTPIHTREDVRDFEALEMAIKALEQEQKWDRLYSWLNDMRLGIAPDETVTDIDERNVRTAQVDLLDEIMEWMVEPQERSEE